MKFNVNRYTLTFREKEFFFLCSVVFACFLFTFFLFAYMCNSYVNCADEILYALKQLKHFSSQIP